MEEGEAVVVEEEEVDEEGLELELTFGFEDEDGL